MLILPLMMALVDGQAANATPADFGHCVDDQAVELAASKGSSTALATVAVERCRHVLDSLVAARNAAAAKSGEKPADRPANAAAYRRSVTAVLEQSAKATIEDRRIRR